MEKYRKGFTLLELIIVLCIMGVIMGFASQSMDLVRRERVSSATRELYSDFQKARLDSMTRAGNGYGIRFESHNAYALFKFEDCNNDFNYDADGCEDGAREETDVVRRELHSSILLHKTNATTDLSNEIRRFDKTGLPWQAGGLLGNITIIVRTEPDCGLARCVSVSLNRIREGLWTKSACR